MFADIIIPLAVDGIFTYSVPEEMENFLAEGNLVLVSFGKNKKYTGIIYRLHMNKPEGYSTKPIESLLDNEIHFSFIHLSFLLWVSEYYMATPGEVFRAALPVIFRLESITSISLATNDSFPTDLTGQQKQLLALLQPGQYINLQDIGKLLKIKNVHPIVKSLLDKKYIQIKETVDDTFSPKKEKYLSFSRPFTEKELSEILNSLRRAPAQYDMLCKWLEINKNSENQKKFLRQCNGTSATLKQLCQKGIFIQEEKNISRLDIGGDIQREAHALSDIQQRVFEEIKNKFRTTDTILLRGVTSSGKTEIYIHLIREYIRQGKQVLYMLPEIALTVQIVQRLKDVFGDEVGIYHSGMPDMVRAEMWKKQCSENPYRVVLGVRSSIFLPFSDLGLIIIDEEHDPSYKQKDPSPRYHGRDAAIMAAKFYGAKVLLGSATPSFESYENTRTGKYQLVCLDQRYGDILMPEIFLADVSEARRKKRMYRHFSPPLYEAIKRVLSEGKQIILLQNRKGYSTYLQCDSCGTTLRCKKCDVSMTYYKNRNTAICRYCGSIVAPPEKCLDCGKGHYGFKAPGTERIEEDIALLFPDARVGRMDTDVMQNKNRLKSVLRNFEERNIDILIGTQMISKGLDFDHVKLVGIMDADMIINYPDFRAEERAYQMLMQVSGRSGRKNERGEVIIQTRDIQNRIFTFIRQGDYDLFYTKLSEERKYFAYPPFYRIIQIELRHKDVVPLRHAVNQLAEKLRKRFGRRVCGPSVPEVAKINNNYRVQLLLKIETGVSYSRTKIVLKQELKDLQADFGGVRVICDVDG